MIHFSLLPDKNDWNPQHYFLDSQDLNDCCEFPDYKFIPWLYHFNMFNVQVYLKKTRKFYQIICHNFNSRKIMLQPRSGYLCATFETFEEAITHFYIIINEILEALRGVSYGLPF